jgi:hypothetical protein
MLYRLFVVWKRDDKAVVVIDGRRKFNNTTISDAEYEKVAALARSVVDDDYEIADADAFARLTFEKAAEARDLDAQVQELQGQVAELEQLLDDATQVDGS